MDPWPERGSGSDRRDRMKDGRHRRRRRNSALEDFCEDGPDVDASEADPRKDGEEASQRSGTGKRMLSPTQICSFLACPRKWYYEYVEKIEVPEKFPLVRGSVVHSVCEDIFRWKPDRDSTYEDLVSGMSDRAHGLLKDHWKKARITEKFGDDRWEETVGMIDRFVQLHDWKMEPIYRRYGDVGKAWYFSRPKFRELRVEDKDLRVRGYIDAVVQRSPEEVVLVDYKTSSVYRHAVSEDHQRQLYIYALLYEREMGVRPAYVAVEYLLYGQVANYPVRKKFLDEVRDLISFVHANTVSQDIEDYETNTEYKFCKWCDFREICQGEPPL